MWGKQVFERYFSQLKKNRISMLGSRSFTHTHTHTHTHTGSGLECWTAQCRKGEDSGALGSGPWRAADRTGRSPSTKWRVFQRPELKINQSLLKTSDGCVLERHILLCYVISSVLNYQSVSELNSSARPNGS